MSEAKHQGVFTVGDLLARGNLSPEEMDWIAEQQALEPAMGPVEFIAMVFSGAHALVAGTRLTIMGTRWLITGGTRATRGAVVRRLTSLFRNRKTLGDLTQDEVRQIQRVVNEATRMSGKQEQLYVVGSAAKAARRNPGTKLPFGKEAGTKSDIDYLVTDPLGSNSRALRRLQDQLPEIDYNALLDERIIFTHRNFLRPGEPKVLFRAGKSPKYIPAR